MVCLIILFLGFFKYLYLEIYLCNRVLLIFFFVVICFMVIVFWVVMYLFKLFFILVGKLLFCCLLICNLIKLLIRVILECSLGLEFIVLRIVFLFFGYDEDFGLRFWSRVRIYIILIIFWCINFNLKFIFCRIFLVFFFFEVIVNLLDILRYLFW